MAHRDRARPGAGGRRGGRPRARPAPCGLRGEPLARRRRARAGPPGDAAGAPAPGGAGGPALLGRGRRPRRPRHRAGARRRARRRRAGRRSGRARASRPARGLPRARAGAGQAGRAGGADRRGCSRARSRPRGPCPQDPRHVGDHRRPHRRRVRGRLPRGQAGGASLRAARAPADRGLLGRPPAQPRQARLRDPAAAPAAAAGRAARSRTATSPRSAAVDEKLLELARTLSGGRWSPTTTI